MFRNKNPRWWLIRATTLLTLLVSAWVFPLFASDHYVAGSGGINAPLQRDKPYLILISIDGFRWDYMERYPTPNLDRIASKGSRAERLIPVFPTLTFPNHYSIATGLYPGHHGVVANEFPDPARNRWYSIYDRETVEDPAYYAGEPIWVTAESQGMVAASFFFVGTEAPIKGVSPSHWRSFDKKISGQERVDQVLEWLKLPEATRPHMYTLYFENVDDHSHSYGTDSDENIQTIRQVDNYIGRLLDGIEAIPHSNQVNIIVVSDHGQGGYIEHQEPFVLNEYVDLEGVKIIESGSYLFLHMDEQDTDRAENIVTTVNGHWQHGRAYLPTDTPENWKVNDNPRFPAVIIIPEAGYAAISKPEKIGKINKGDHGWAPEAPAMHGFFIASGPDIKAGVSLGSIRNIDIYPLMTSILGLEPSANIDSDPSAVAEQLRPTP